MKTSFIIVVAMSLISHCAFGQMQQIEQRARETARQNNVRQGVPQTSQPAAPAPVAKPITQAAPSATQIQQQHVNRIRSDIAAILAGSSQEKIQKLAADLTNAARGPKKSSPAAISKLAGSIGANLTNKTLGSAEQLRLAQDLDAVVNSAKFSQLQANAYVSDVQAVLQVAGVKRDAAVSAAGDVKAAMAEIRP